MVLVSFLLVLAAAVTLVVGLLQSGLGLIYVSIGCSVVAGLVLAAAVLRGRPDGDSVPAGPRAAPAGTGTPPPQSWQPTSPQPEPQLEPTAAGASTAVWGRPDGTPAPPGDDNVSPEAAGLAERLRQRREAGGDHVEADDESGTEEVELAGPGSDFDGDDDDEDDDDENDMGEMPIDDYDRLRASEILAQLPGLTRPQLLAVRAHEMSTMNRFTVMSRIEGELARQGGADETWEVEDADWDDDDDEPVAPGRATRTTRKATTGRSRSTASRAAQKVPARKATSTKATARKSAVKKAATTTRTPAAKATARKATATRAPAKKATAKKAAASRTTAKRATKRT